MLEPTRGEAILDLVISTEQNLIRNLKIQEPVSNSDHNSVYFKVLVKRPGVSNNHTRYAFHKTDYRKFKEKMLKWNWKEELKNCSVDNMIDIFSRFMEDAINDCVPVFKPNNKRQFPKWMTYKVKCIRNSK